MAKVVRIAVVVATLVLAARSGSGGAAVENTASPSELGVVSTTQPPAATTSTVATTSLASVGAGVSATRILFVGNSLMFYRGGPGTQLSGLASSGTPASIVEAEESALPSFTLETHWKYSSTPSGLVNAAAVMVAGLGLILIVPGTASLRVGKHPEAQDQETN